MTTNLKDVLGISALNANEQKVLHATLLAASGNGYDFTFGNEVLVQGMGRSAVGAYIADLQAKGFLEIFQEETAKGTKIGTSQICWDGALREYIEGATMDGLDQLVNQFEPGK